MKNEILCYAKCAVVTLLLAIGVPVYGQFKAYDKVFDFDQWGYAVVCNNYETDHQLMGVVDETGREIVPLQYYNVEVVGRDVAVVTNDGSDTRKAALLSLKTGKIITDFKYNGISFDHGFGFAETETGSELIDSNGHKTKNVNLEMANYMGDDFLRNIVDDDNVMFYHLNGTPISEKIFRNVYDFGDFEAGQENGWLQVWLPDTELEEKFSYWLSNDGTLLSNNDYLAKVKYKNNKYYVRYDDELNEMEIVSTKDGSTHATFKADDYTCADGIIIIKKDGLYGLMDYDGKEIVKCNLKRIGNFSEGLVYAQNNQGEEFFMDIHGNKAFDYTGKFTKYETEYKTGSTRRYVSEGPSFMEGLAPYRSNGNVGFINENGEVVISAKYKDVCPFMNGYAIVQDAQSQKYGMINKVGSIVLPCEYNACYYSTKGYAIVKTTERKETFLKIRN